MKKIIYMIIFAAAFTACSDGIGLNPAMSLFNDRPEILDETAVFRLAVVNMPDSSERRFPVVFGGTAEHGVDYEASADEFVYGGENPVESIVLTTLKFGTGKTVSLSVELPEGMESGKYMTSEYILHDNPAYISFAQPYKIMPDSTFISFTLNDKDGKSKALGIDAEISVSVVADKSTAVEGEDFEFADSSHFTIKSGQNKGELKIKKLKVRPTAGRDKIVLALSHAEKFGEGFVRELEIDLMDTLWRTLDGRWSIDTLVTDTTYMEKFWGAQCSGYDLFPKYKSNDAVKFDLEASVFEPSFFSDFDMYFIGDSGFRMGSDLTLDLGDGRSAELQTFVLDNTNRYFAKDPVSEDKESLVGARIIEGQEEAPDTLDFYVIDYTSKSFMPELETMNRYAAEKPVAASPGLYLNLKFLK